MTEDERGAYRTFEQILKNDLSHPHEKENARRQMDALEWKGDNGPIFKKLKALEDRIAALEGGKGKTSAKLTKKGEADMIAHVIEEAKTAIHAEAQAAAVEAVGKLMGD